MDKRNQSREKQAAGEIVVQSRFGKWLDNVWYHYKWHILVVGFFLLTFTVCFVQCSGKSDGDITVAFAGSYTFDGDDREAVIDVLESVSPKKEGEDSRMSILLNDYSVYTEEELKKLYTDENGNLSAMGYNNAKQVNRSHLETFSTYVKTGSCAVWFVSEFVYEAQNLSKIALPLSEIYGDSLPAGAVDDYAIRLGDTALYQYYDALKILPADTLIVMPHRQVWGESANEDTYATFLDLFRGIVDFQKP